MVDAIAFNINCWQLCSVFVTESACLVGFESMYIMLEFSCASCTYGIWGRRWFSVFSCVLFQQMLVLEFFACTV